MNLSKHYLQCSNKSIHTKTKQKGREAKQISKYQKVRTASHSMPFRNANTSHLYSKKCVTYYTITYSQGSQVSLSAQQPPLRESFGRSNQCGPKASQASYGHPRCNLNLMHLLFRPSLPLPSFGLLFLSPQPRGQRPPTPFDHYIVPSPNTPEQMQWSISHVRFFDGRENNALK